MDDTRSSSCTRRRSSSCARRRSSSCTIYDLHRSYRSYMIISTRRRKKKRRNQGRARETQETKATHKHETRGKKGGARNKEATKLGRLHK